MIETFSIKKYVAEFLGTFVLVLMGCGSAVLAGSQIGIIGISFAFGLAVSAMAYTIGGISGCHINPAVSISMFAAGRMRLKDTVLYVLMQCIGATVGAAVLFYIAIGNPGYSLSINGLGQNGFGTASMTGISVVSAFLVEAVLSFVFLLVIFGTTGRMGNKSFAGMAIGFSLVLIHLVGIPMTGTSVNPARSLGPALIVGGLAIDQLWLFWAAPIFGALVAAAVSRLFD